MAPVFIFSLVASIFKSPHHKKNLLIGFTLHLHSCKHCNHTILLLRKNVKDNNEKDV